MPKAFIINEQLDGSVRSRVVNRLAEIGYQALDWPTSLASSISEGDVSLYVLLGPNCTAAEEQRINEAVHHGLPIIVIYLDEKPAGTPGALRDYASSMVPLAAENLPEILGRNESSYIEADNRPAPKNEIKHNKC